MNITRDGRGWRLESRQWLALPPEELFPFFGDAHNLEKLTPALLKFQVLKPRPIPMGPGTLIDYRLKVRGLPIRWRTEILAWDPPHRFIDNQLRGPYRRWHHTHLFEPVDGGTRCTDIVHYELYGGPLAPLINRLLIQRDVQQIFAYREQVLAGIFGTSPDHAPSAAAPSPAATAP